MPTYHGIARSSTPASTRAACEDHPTRPVQLRKGHAHGELECGFEGQQWAGAGVPVPSFADPATAAAQLRPLFEPIGGNWRWSFLQPSAAPRTVLTGGGRECAVYPLRIRLRSRYVEIQYILYPLYLDQIQWIRSVSALGPDTVDTYRPCRHGTDAYPREFGVAPEHNTHDYDHNSIGDGDQVIR